MAKQSYIKKDTTVVCTNMTIPSTSFIGVEEERKLIKKTFKGSESRPLLNVDDKKLEVSFSCKMPPKKWGGLSLKCLGILIIGAIIIVGTGGTAAPFLIAAMVVAGIGFVGGALWAAYSTYHACDQTLDPPCKWLLYHRKVSIEGKRALLNRSIMVCSNGGVISIILNPQIAAKAAKFISDNNNKELTIQFISQFAYGLVESVQYLGGGIGVISLIVSGGLYMWQEEGVSEVPKYAEKELLKEEMRIKEESFWDSAGGNITQDGGNVIIGGGTGIADDILKGTENSTLSKSIKSYKFNGKNFAKGIGLSIVISVIDYFVNEWEGNIQEETAEAAYNFDQDDSENHIGIYAVKAL